jgi:glyoxalase family protein
MPKPIVGLHHVTAIASDPQRTLEFYTQVLGLRLVKRTVNFDDPETYHFYFGDDTGSPGTILTFFPWEGASPGSMGIGETSATAFRVPEGSLEFWESRLLSAGAPVERLGERFGESVIRCGDPDGMRLEIVARDQPGEFREPRNSSIPARHAIRGFHGVTLSESSDELTAAVLEAMGLRRFGEENDRIRFTGQDGTLGNVVDVVQHPRLGHGRLGAGSVHHIAFRVPDDAAQIEWRELLVSMGLHVTDVRDRIYFHSVYFREPGGVLFELATDPPGFALDEPLESLGEALKLPPWLESRRSALESALPPIEMPHQSAEHSHE